MGAKKLRVGIVGTGAIAQGQHLPHWQALVQQGRVELAAVCDVVEERARDVAERFGAVSPVGGCFTFGRSPWVGR